jgi:hypothetical protein
MPEEAHMGRAGRFVRTAVAGAAAGAMSVGALSVATTSVASAAKAGATKAAKAPKAATNPSSASSTTGSAINEQLSVCVEVNYYVGNLPCVNIPLPQAAATLQGALSNAVALLCQSLPHRLVGLCDPIGFPSDYEFYEAVGSFFAVALDEAPCGIEVRGGAAISYKSDLLDFSVELHNADCYVPF